MILTFAPLLLAALILDAIFGEPKAIWSRIPHPAVLMGLAVDLMDRTFNEGDARRNKGVLAVGILGAGAIALGVAIVSLPLGWLWTILGGAILLAQKSLSEHVRAVADALRVSTEEGRASVAMIVGRDTQEMEPHDIARAAIESAAENMSDGVTAPAFWFLIAGLPGILSYKIINTADSMIGHRNERYEDFGWAAAKLDDLLNWVPARITAALIALTHPNRDAWATAMREAGKHRSPNAGWPEAALAATLKVALSGPRRYDGKLTDDPFVFEQGNRSPGPDDIDAAMDAMGRVWASILAVVVLLSLF
ncbi:MAG: adenosylcobinamide-phosphate synthase CbiB [Pseudomonadota bacterium]